MVHSVNGLWGSKESGTIIENSRESKPKEILLLLKEGFEIDESRGKKFEHESGIQIERNIIVLRKKVLKKLTVGERNSRIRKGVSTGGAYPQLLVGEEVEKVNNKAEKTEYF